MNPEVTPEERAADAAQCKREKALQKHWKDDFSVDWDATEYISRREFTRFLGLSSAGLAAGSTLIAAADSLRASGESGEKGPRVRLGRVSEMQPGTSRAFEYPREGLYALLLRHDDGTYSAFSQKCPHLGCAVYFEHEKNVLECPCHEGFFEPRTGNVISGPPQRGLSRVELEVDGDDLWAIGGGGH